MSGNEENSLLYFNDKEFSPRFGDNFYTVDVLGYSVGGIPSACGGTFAEYHLQVRRGKRSWLVKRRFSDFDRMQLALRREHPDIETSLPLLPAKTCLSWGCLEESFLNSRREELAGYLESLLTVFSNKRVLLAEAATLFEFLDMEGMGKGEKSS